MDVDKLNRWLTLLANIGVIAGILFLALEIRQNSDQLATQIEINQHQIRVSDIGRLAANNDLAVAKLKLMRGEELTDVERERMYWMYATRFANWELGFRLGYFSTHGPIAAFRRTPRSIEFWHEYKPFLDKAFVRFVEAEVISQL